MRTLRSSPDSLSHNWNFNKSPGRFLNTTESWETQILSCLSLSLHLFILLMAYSESKNTLFVCFIAFPVTPSKGSFMRAKPASYLLPYSSEANNKNYWMNRFWAHSLILTFISVLSPIYFTFSPPFQVAFIHQILTSPQILFSHIPIALALWSPSYYRTNSNTQLHSHFECLCVCYLQPECKLEEDSVGFTPFGCFLERSGWMHSFYEERKTHQKRYRETL